MTRRFRFAIISDPHIALPETIWNHPSRFHLVEVSIPALEQVLTHLEAIDLDFLLLPGDLTQHGEAVNHSWLAERLAQLPFPCYVVPGNHDIIQRSPTERAIGLSDFPRYYRKFGYEESDRPYYSRVILPGVRLIGLNSIAFHDDGQQYHTGHIDTAQLAWLEQTLEAAQNDLVLLMVHHNLVEHLPGQSQNDMGRRYMTSNAANVLSLLHRFNVQLIFTGHLHVQDVARDRTLYEITTGSLVSFPHPYRILQYQEDAQGKARLELASERVLAVPSFPDLQTTSREWIGDRSYHFMLRLLTQSPLSLPAEEAELLVADLRYFWANIAQGDQIFDFAHFPSHVRDYLHRFSAIAPIDNEAILHL